MVCDDPARRVESAPQPGHRVMRGIHHASYTVPLCLSRGTVGLPDTMRSARPGIAQPRRRIDPAWTSGWRSQPAPPPGLPTQDFDLFDRLPPRRHPRAIVISLPAAPVAPAPPLFPNEVLRAAVLLMMRSPPTLAPGAGPHPGILNWFVNGHHGFPPGYGITNPYDQVLPGRLSNRKGTAVPPLAQPIAPEAGRTYPSVCATFGGCGVARSRLRFGALTYPMSSPQRYPSCPQSGTGRVGRCKAS